MHQTPCGILFWQVWVLAVQAGQPSGWTQVAFEGHVLCVKLLKASIPDTKSGIWLWCWSSLPMGLLCLALQPCLPCNNSSLVVNDYRNFSQLNKTHTRSGQPARQNVTTRGWLVGNLLHRSAPAELFGLFLFSKALLLQGKSTI